jgi:outer membrane protein TolC
MEQLEEVALINNADLREQHYNARIARDETRRTMMRLFPNITFSYDYKYDSDNYMLHNRWNETGVQLSFNLMNLFTGASQLKLAEAGVTLAEHRRMTTQMSVLAQVHLARLEAMNARNQFLRADAIYDTDKKIADIMRNRASAQAQSKLDMVSSDTASILSLLRRYQALAQVQVAENRMLATLGLEPYVGDPNLISLKELTSGLAQAQAPWEQLRAGKALPKTSPSW